MPGFDVEVLEILKSAGGIITMLAGQKIVNPRFIQFHLR